MTGIVCTIVGNSVVTAVAEVIRRKKSIAALGNAQVDYAQSKFGGSSVLLAGDGSSLRVQSDSSFAFGTGNFTIEFWLRLNSTATQFIYDQRSADSQAVASLYYFENSLRYYVLGNDRINGGSLSTGVWYHIAVARSGSSTRLFVNGSQVGSTYTDNTTYIQGSNIILGDRYTLNTPLNGWIDEVRISNTARYTANFTEPSAPFVNDANTLLLLHMNGQDGSAIDSATTFFEDDNGIRSPKSLQAAGGVQIDTAQSKFGGAAALFDGTGDYFIIRTDSDLQFTSSESWTIEFWFRADTVAGSDQRHMLATYNTSSPFNGYAVKIGNGTGTDGIVYFWDGVSWRAFNTTVAINTWYHVAIVSDAGSCKMYLDGTQQNTTFTATSSINNTTQNLYIGSRTDGNNGWDGWLDEIRFSKTARYTASFTAPTAPFVNDSNTLLLLHMDGTDTIATVLDDNGVRAKKGIAAFGNAQTSTAQSKFGGSSALFDGTGDGLLINGAVMPLSGDFTVEYWIYQSADSSDYHLGQYSGSSTGRFNMGYDATDDKIFYFWGGTGYPSVQKTTSTVSLNTWYHVALTREGGTIRLFLNGVLENTQTGFTSITVQDTNFTIGYAPALASTEGYIDEVRISNTARYTANFTPSTVPFQNDENTVLLLHMDGTNGGVIFVDDNGVTPTHQYS